MAELTVQTLVPVTQRVGKVTFTEGMATVDDKEHALELAYFRRAGYRIFAAGEAPEEGPEHIVAETPAETETEAVEVAEAPEGVAIKGMPPASATRGELAEFAEGLGIDTESLSKAQIRERIIEAHS